MASYRFDGEYLYENMVLTKTIPRTSVDRMRGMTVIGGDVLVASYPKTGTTWVGQITLLINSNCDPELTLEESKIYGKLVFLESSYSKDVEGGFFSGDPRSPAVIKTHLTPPLLEKILDQGHAKVILVARNPKDTLVSLYHFYRMNSNLGNFQGPWDDFFELYKSKHMLYGDYFDWYTSWLPLVDNPIVHLIKYEDLYDNPFDCVKKLSAFLGKSFTDDQIQTIIERSSFENMRHDKSVNHTTIENMKAEISPFIRKGQVGDWKNYFTTEQNRYVDEEYKTKLEAKGFKLRFEM